MQHIKTLILKRCGSLDRKKVGLRRDGKDEDPHSHSEAWDLVIAPKDFSVLEIGNNHHRVIGGGYLTFKRMHMEVHF